MAGCSVYLLRKKCLLSAGTHSSLKPFCGIVYNLMGLLTTVADIYLQYMLRDTFGLVEIALKIRQSF